MSFGVRPDRRFDKEQDKHVVVGYEASHRVGEELSFDKEPFDRVLGQAAQSASEAAVTVSFDVSGQDALRRRAMRAAIADAQEAARVLAEASGTTLGEIARIDFSYVEVRTRCLTYELADSLVAESAAAPALDVEPQALEAEEGVTIVWEVSS